MLDLTFVENLLLNMSEGLLPNQLSADEVVALSEKYSKNGFTLLGYSEPTYERSEFDTAQQIGD